MPQLKVALCPILQISNALFCDSNQACRGNAGEQCHDHCHHLRCDTRQTSIFAAHVALAYPLSINT